MIEFGFENPKPPWTEMTSFFPCGRGHSLLQRVLVRQVEDSCGCQQEIDVSGDRLKREIPSPKDRVKPLFWTAKHLSDRVIEGGKYELKRIVEARRDAKGEWEFLCEWRA